MIKIKPYIFLLLISGCISLPHLSYSQIKEFRFEQLDSLQKFEKRPVIVFLHTAWCKYCSTMKNSTLKDKDVVNLLTQKFYFITLDIEEKQEILFRNYTFKYKPTGLNTGINELAEQLGTINGQVSYPAISFLNADYEIIYQQEGFVSPKDFLSILTKLTAVINKWNK